jgi:predicted dehydrogenase
MKKLNIAIVGLGGVAQAHLQAFDLLPALNIVAVCDVRQEIAKTIGDKYQAEVYTDYCSLIQAGGMDLVMVLTPASTHREIVEAVAAAGHHVFCEKPLAVSEEDGEAIVAACQKAKVKLFYGSCYRYLPAVKKAQELIKSGVIGHVQLMTEQVIGGHGLAGYRELAPIHYPIGGPGGPGMGLVDHGVHLIDIFSWFTQSEIISVQGQGQISGAPAASEFMAMTFESGALGHLIYNAATHPTVLPNEGMFSDGQGWLADCSLTHAGLWEQDPGSIAVYGSKGSLRIFHYTNALFLNTGNGPQQIELSGRPAFGHFATQLEDCADAILTDREPTISGKDGLRLLKTLLRVYPE